MDFLKQHYEKVVLGALLLGFVLALIYLLQVIGSAKEITVKDLEFVAPTTKYELATFTEQEYDVNYLLNKRAEWQVRGDGENAELGVPMRGMRCSGCHMIVPQETVRKSLQCPLCGKKLEAPPETAELAGDLGGRDSDGDGMPDTYEKKMGFNPQNPMDASMDNDMDKFSNVYEYLMGTDPNNAKSYPGLDRQIYLARLRKPLLSVKLDGVLKIADASDPNSKKQWDISLTVNRMRTSARIGDELEIDKENYKVLDADYKMEQNPDDPQGEAKDASTVVLEKQDGSGEKVTLKVGEKAYGAVPRAEIKDILTGRTYRVGIGDSFTVGDEKKGSAKFTVVKANDETGLLTIKNQETGIETVMSSNIKVPDWARINNNRMGMDPNMGMMGPGMMGPGRMNQQDQSRPRSNRGRNTRTRN